MTLSKSKSQIYTLLTQSILDNLLSIRCISSNQIIYKKNDEVVSFFGDFLEDFKDTKPFGEPIGYGTYLMIKKSFLSEFTEEKKCKVGILAKHTSIKLNSLVREDRYEKDEKFEKLLLNI